jgi:hypothetical protein
MHFLGFTLAFHVSIDPSAVTIYCVLSCSLSPFLRRTPCTFCCFDSIQQQSFLKQNDLYVIVARTEKKFCVKGDLFKLQLLMSMHVATQWSCLVAFFCFFAALRVPFNASTGKHWTGGYRAARFSTPWGSTHEYC